MANARIDFETASLAIDDDGRVRSLISADGIELTVRGSSAFCLETDRAVRLPVSVTLVDDKLTVEFEAGATAEFRVFPQRGFVLFELQELATPETVRRFRLFSLPVAGEGERADTINACTVGTHVVSVMAAELNVHAFLSRSRTYRADRDGCTHQFVQTGAEHRVGRYAARFTATSTRTDNAGWSVRGKAFSSPLDLSGCKAIRAWVRGDGKGQQLKIQLHDGAQGYRDDYVKIDFADWRQVVLTDSALDTVRYDRVRRLNFYYNGLPADQTVTCLIDHVEALLERDGKEEIVVLENFERPDSSLWDGAPLALNAETIDRHGIEPARFGVIACRQEDFADTVQRFEAAAGLPSPKLGGAWNKTSPWVKRSYLFITRFSESQFNDALALARRGGFHTILILGGSWHKTTGHYEVNTKNFPDGLAGLQRTVRRFKEAGFKVGLHFLGASIYPPDAYLVPVPDKRLAKGASATLAADVDAKADFIPTTKPPEDFPAEDGGYRGKGTVLWIGDELVHYEARSMKPPFGFLKCRRGYIGTRPAPQKKGNRIHHLLRSFGYHMFDMDTTLLDEVAGNFAKVANACDVDMLYFDGSERLQGDHWYYNARLHKAFYDKLNNKDILLQASSFSHYSWHMLARSASADGHGDIKGYLDARSPWFNTLARNLMPLDVGWYYGYDPDATPDVFEYVLGTTIGYGASMSFQVSVEAAAKHPFTGRILDLIRRYEKLRLSGRVSAEMRARLRIDPALGGEMKPEKRKALLNKRREFHLLGSDGEEVFQRVVYSPWREVKALDGGSNVWHVKVNDGPARVGVQIQATGGPWLRPGPAYYADDALVLETFDDLAAYVHDPKGQSVVHAIEPGQSGSVSKGVTQRFTSTDRHARQGPRCAVYTATNDRTSSDGWSMIEKRFDPPADLSWHKGIGFWLRGDGKGGQFKLQLRDAGKGWVDYYVANDFVGWRYQQLGRPAKDNLDYTKVRRLLFYYNALPGETTVSCGIDDVKALRRLDKRRIVDPSVDVGGKQFAWKGSLSAGEYLFFLPGEPVTRYGARLGDGEICSIPSRAVTFPMGEYPVTFGCGEPLTTTVRVRAILYPPEHYPIK